MMLAYCTDRNIDTVAVYLTHALFNSMKRSTNPSSASLNRFFSHCFNVQLEYNSDMGASDISPSQCLTIGGDLTAVTLRFTSTQLFMAHTVEGRKWLKGSCTP